MTMLATPNDIARLLEEVAQSPLMPRLQQQLNQLTAVERENRSRYYSRLTGEYRAEFINGEEVLAMPAKKQHIDVIELLLFLLQAFLRLSNLGYAARENALTVFERNDYLPDVCFWRRDKSDQFTPDQIKFPPPDFIVEVPSESTRLRDRGVKFQDYAAHGVQEYWIVDPESETVEQYVLDHTASVYELQLKSQTGMITSVVVTGFEIPIRAIFDRDENTITLMKLLGR
jgi:Uma2 family endonuclease